MLTLETEILFRYRLILATLTQKPIKITQIRPDDENIGVSQEEIAFLRLLEALQNGPMIDISYTGTTVTYKPGTLIGGDVDFDCQQQPIGYFLEPIIALAPYMKNPLKLSLTGVTNSCSFLSVDSMRTVTVQQLKKFGIEAELQVKKRGAEPQGGGLVIFSCQNVKQVKPVQFVEEGRIRKIRGVAYSTRVSPQTSNRMVESARSLLNKFIPDVFIYSDVSRGTDSGLSPGFGLTLVAESTSGAILSTELMAQSGETPEDVGINAAKALYQEISYGGCVDSQSQWLNLLYMAISSEDVSKIRVGKLTQFTIAFLRDLKEATGVQFKIIPDTETKTVLMTCVGIGLVNVNKKST